MARKKPEKEPPKVSISEVLSAIERAAQVDKQINDLQRDRQAIKSVTDKILKSLEDVDASTLFDGLPSAENSPATAHEAVCMIRGIIYNIEFYLDDDAEPPRWYVENIESMDDMVTFKEPKND